MFTQKELASLMHDLIEETNHQQVKVGRSWATLSETFNDDLDLVGGLSFQETQQIRAEIEKQEAAKSDPAKRIADMDLSNLSDEQIEVIRQLTLRAEDGFDKRASLADNDDVKNIANSHADACMRLLGRLRDEANNRTVAA